MIHERSGRGGHSSRSTAAARHERTRLGRIEAAADDHGGVVGCVVGLEEPLHVLEADRGHIVGPLGQTVVRVASTEDRVR